MATIISMAPPLAERLSRDFFVHAAEDRNSAWIQSGDLTPDGSEILFFVRSDGPDMVTIDDRGLSESFLTPDYFASDRKLQSFRNRLRLQGCDFDPASHTIYVRSPVQQVANAAKRLRHAIRYLVRISPA